MIKPMIIHEVNEYISECAVEFKSISSKIINESTVDMGSVGGKVPIVTLEVVLQSFGVRNWNGRIYDEDVVMNAIKNDGNIQLDMSKGQWMGEFGHPDTKEVKRILTLDPKCCSHRILKVWVEGNLLKAHVQSLPYGYGVAMAMNALAGVPAAFSLRALGSTDASGRAKAPLKVVTFDYVYRPSHKEAYQSDNAMVEAAGDSLYTPDVNIEEIIRENSNVIQLTESVVLDEVIAMEKEVRDTDKVMEECAHALGKGYDVYLAENFNGAKVTKGDKSVNLSFKQMLDLDYGDVMLGKGE